jgi:hypothetical protein
MEALMRRTRWVMVEGVLSGFKYGFLVGLLCFPEDEVMVSSLCETVFLAKGGFLWVDIG